MQYNFPVIKTTRTPHQQACKIFNEVGEYLQDGSDEDEEAVDVLHAVETFIRVHFKGREERLNELIQQVTAKNSSRGYYEQDCY